MNTWYKSLFIAFTLKKGLGVWSSKWTLIHPYVALGLFKHFFAMACVDMREGVGFGQKHSVLLLREQQRI